MKYIENESGNKAGRPVGSTNKATGKLREWLTEFLEDRREQIIADWDKLEPRDRILLFEKLLKYSLPTLQATTLTSEFDKLTDHDLDRIISALCKAA